MAHDSQDRDDRHPRDGASDPLQPEMLTPSERESLRRDANEAIAYGKEALARLRTQGRGSAAEQRCEAATGSADPEAGGANGS